MTSVLRDGMAAAVERRDRRVAGCHAEHEEARGAGGTHLGDLRVRDEHVGRCGTQADNTSGACLEQQRRVIRGCYRGDRTGGLGLRKRGHGQASQRGRDGNIAKDLHQNLNSFASPEPE